nr:unnamed protein product [Callosobruchus analis]
MKPEIWHATNKFYYNKHKKKHAWSEIAKDMDTTVEPVPKSKITRCQCYSTIPNKVSRLLVTPS